MVYCCYESAVALGHNKKSGDLMKYIRWQMKI